MIESGTFAEACYEMNTIAELEESFKVGVDENDLKTWGITAEEWKENITLAIEELKSEM